MEEGKGRGECLALLLTLFSSIGDYSAEVRLKGWGRSVPSGHAVLIWPCNSISMLVILVGFAMFRTSRPRSRDGGSSCGLCWAWRKTTGSVRRMERELCLNWGGLILSMIKRWWVEMQLDLPCRSRDFDDRIDARVDDFTAPPPVWTVTLVI
jgi:hypothetical protein